MIQTPEHIELSVIIPTYNEEGNIALLIQRLEQTMQVMGCSSYEYLFIDDGSTDHSLEKIKRSRAQNNRVHFLQFSKNFGHQYALKAGLDHARGAAVVTGADALRQKLGSKSVVHRDAGAMCGDLLVTDGVHIIVGTIDLEVRYTPGHTNGCISFFAGDRIFTGDSLLIGGCGRTDFQSGDSGQLYDSIHHQIFSLPDEVIVYPGHDYNGNTQSTVGEERNVSFPPLVVSTAFPPMKVLPVIGSSISAYDISFNDGRAMVRA